MIDELFDGLIAEVRIKTIDECIKTLEESYPYTAESDVIYGFSCAINRLKQMKGENDG